MIWNPEGDKQRALLLAIAAALIAASSANVGALLGAPKPAATPGQTTSGPVVVASNVGQQAPAATPTPEPNPCQPTGDSPPESGTCLRYSLNQLERQVAKLQRDMRAQQAILHQPPPPTPSVPPDLDRRLGRLERDVAGLHSSLNALNSHLRRAPSEESGKSDAVDDIWSEIDRIKKRLHM